MEEAIARDSLGEDLGRRIVRARVDYYRLVVHGDRFDGGPNFDTERGGEEALRALAADYALEVPDEEQTGREATALLREEIGRRTRLADEESADDRALLDYLEAVEKEVAERLSAALGVPREDQGWRRGDGRMTPDSARGLGGFEGRLIPPEAFGAGGTREVRVRIEEGILSVEEVPEGVSVRVIDVDEGVETEAPIDESVWVRGGGANGEPERIFREERHGDRRG